MGTVVHFSRKVMPPENLVTTFGKLSVGDRFRIKPTPSCPKGPGPVFEKIVAEPDPMDAEGPWRNCQLAGDPCKKNFFYNPILVLLVN